MPVMIVGRRREDEKTRRRENDPRSSLTRLGGWAEAWYERGMRWALRNPGPVFGVAIASVALTVWVLGRIPREILPQVDEGMVVASVHLPEGTAIEATTQQVARIEDAARALGAKGIYSRVGIATDEEILAGAEPGSSATAQLLVPVPEGQKAATFADKLRAAVPDLAGVMVTIARGHLGELSAEQVRAALRPLLNMPLNPRMRAIVLSNLVEVQVAEGALDTALVSLGQLADTLLYDVVWLDRCRLLDPLRSHPVFLEIVSAARARCDQVWAREVG